MSQNIFQVINETHLDEILSQHVKSLIVVMLSSKNCGPCKTIKPKFVALAKHHQDMFFVYIDRTNYDVMNNKYFADYQFTPTFLFYFGGNRVAFFEGAHEESLVKIVTILKQKIEDKKQEMLQKEQMIENQIQNLQNNSLTENHQVNPHTELAQNKINGLNKLRELVQKGAKLTRSYNLDSEIDDINFEIRFQTDSQFRQQILNFKNQQSSPQTVQKQQEEPPKKAQHDELQQKQEQVKQIQELDNLHQKMQMQSLQKLQLLKKIKQMKEQQELHNSDPK